ncbi:hypothetical protein [Pleurocapsa sp. PCC 7327]|uniref:hypothetical protein n=1 Tax=Pleurocapsa sp. PCC 7327 TaxID=118163 RepID=UPI0002F9E642|nr:hypothetical protein [Pleurocapsa sp. PCC 7327]
MEFVFVGIIGFLLGAGLLYWLQKRQLENTQHRLEQARVALEQTEAQLRELQQSQGKSPEEIEKSYQNRIQALEQAHQSKLEEIEAAYQARIEELRANL